MSSEEWRMSIGNPSFDVFQLSDEHVE
ncbi:MAG: hypothetical protein JWR46_4149, partial [Mycobacterium sp.]|nr:hypothetical protein [Mycobacterium sp.]